MLKFEKKLATLWKKIDSKSVYNEKYLKKLKSKKQFAVIEYKKRLSMYFFISTIDKFKL